MSYAARIARIVTRPHPNADKIQLGTCLGYQVVVGLDVPSGTLGILFPADGQLSEEYCRANDLVSRIDENGNKAGGFFCEKRRVRAQKFRGEKSEAYWAPLSSLYAMKGGIGKVSDVAEGDAFTEWEGIPLCCRYETPATRRQRENTKLQGPAKRGETLQFRKHFETDQLRFNLQRIPVGALVVITEKLHGTSHRVGRVLERAPEGRLLQLWNRYAPRRWRTAPSRTWSTLHGSRNVILEGGQDIFHGGGFRQKATAGLEERLRKGEVLYGEIVGYSSGTTPIMAPHDLGKLRDKELSKRYPSPMVYRYGVPVGDAKFFVYRIVQTTEDGDQVELSWAAVKQRCAELGVAHVPELNALIFEDGSQAAELLALCDRLGDAASSLDPSHLAEGVCVRVESGAGTLTLKHKSFNFGVLEGYLKDNSDTPDAEEAA